MYVTVLRPLHPFGDYVQIGRRHRQDELRAIDRENALRLLPRLRA